MVRRDHLAAGWMAQTAAARPVNRSCGPGRPHPNAVARPGSGDGSAAMGYDVLVLAPLRRGLQKGPALRGRGLAWETPWQHARPVPIKAACFKAAAGP